MQNKKEERVQPSTCGRITDFSFETCEIHNNVVIKELSHLLSFRVNRTKSTDTQLALNYFHGNDK